MHGHDGLGVLVDLIHGHEEWVRAQEKSVIICGLPLHLLEYLVMKVLVEMVEDAHVHMVVVKAEGKELDVFLICEFYHCMAAVGFFSVEEMYCEAILAHRRVEVDAEDLCPAGEVMDDVFVVEDFIEMLEEFLLAVFLAEFDKLLNLFGRELLVEADLIEDILIECADNVEESGCLGGEELLGCLYCSLIFFR